MKFNKIVYLLILFLGLLVYSCDEEQTCEDGIQNQGETGVDCGGVNCPSCDNVANCFDGVENGSETGIDCGGDCEPCVNTATCFDGIINQNEQGVDCGGVCEDEFGLICDTGGGDPCDNLDNTFNYSDDGTAVINPIILISNTGGTEAISATDYNPNGTLKISIPTGQLTTGVKAVNNIEILAEFQVQGAGIVYSTNSPGFSGNVEITDIQTGGGDCKYLTGVFDFIIAEPGGMTKQFVGDFTELEY